jgi:hypothetical protein
MIKSRRMRWEDHVACMGEKIGAYRALVGKPEGKRTLGRTWCRGEANIKVDLGELVWEDVDWIDMVVMNIRSQKRRRITLLDDAVFPFQEGFCYVELVS